MILFAFLMVTRRPVPSVVVTGNLSVAFATGMSDPATQVQPCGRRIAAGAERFPWLDEEDSRTADCLWDLQPARHEEIKATGKPATSVRRAIAGSMWGTSNLPFITI